MKFSISQHGSICLIQPRDQAARKWFLKTAPSDAQFLGSALAVELRYVEGVIFAIEEAGGLVIGQGDL